jgi:hypothetical protein
MKASVTVLPRKLHIDLVNIVLIEYNAIYCGNGSQKMGQTEGQRKQEKAGTNI